MAETPAEILQRRGFTLMTRDYARKRGGWIHVERVEERIPGDAGHEILAMFSRANLRMVLEGHPTAFGPIQEHVAQAEELGGGRVRVAHRLLLRYK